MSSLLWLGQTASMEHVLSALQKINNLIDFNHQIERQPAALKLMPVFWQAAVEENRSINGYCIDLVSVDDCGCVTLKYDNRKFTDSCVFTLSTKSSGTGQCCTSIFIKLQMNENDMSVRLTLISVTILKSAPNGRFHFHMYVAGENYILRKNAIDFPFSYNSQLFPISAGNGLWFDIPITILFQNRLQFQRYETVFVIIFIRVYKLFFNSRAEILSILRYI